MKDRPTGIIRTLPSLEPGHIGRKRYEQSIRGLQQDRLNAIYIALSQVPKLEVLHLYILMEGEIKVRLNISHYEPGNMRQCWDETIRQPKIWVVCTAPVSFPPQPIKHRGFQGFRYTGDLW